MTQSPWSPPSTSASLLDQGAVQITSVQAAALLEGRRPYRELPEPGCGMTLRLRADVSACTHWLRLWNISGTYLLVCRTLLPEDWARVFNLDQLRIQ